MDARLVICELAGLCFASGLLVVFRYRWRLSRGDYLFLMSTMGLYLLSFCAPPFLAMICDYSTMLPEYTEISLESIACVLVISLSVSLFSIMYALGSYKRKSGGEFQITANKKLLADFAIAGGLLVVCYMGYSFGTLYVGIPPNYSLPFRLNGVIEYLMLFLVPFYVSFWCFNRGLPPLIPCSIMGLYAALNLYLTGSKWAALFPVVVSFLFFVYSRARLRQLAVFFVVFLAVYGVLNPYYFRGELRDGFAVGLSDSFRTSYAAKQGSGYSGLEGVLRGAYFLTSRLNGYFPMVWAVDISKDLDGITPDVYEYVNSVIVTGPNSQVGTGLFGFFMVFFGSSLGGLAAALVVLFILFSINRKISSGNVLVYGPVAFCSCAMYIVALGRVGYAGTYLGAIVCLLAVYALERVYAVTKVVSTETNGAGTQPARRICGIDLHQGHLMANCFVEGSANRAAKRREIR